MKPTFIKSKNAKNTKNIAPISAKLAIKKNRKKMN